ncbi:anti-sigma factor family protein [Nonomuraea fastidiosa]|uniref:anti-sigma factor family protein n=1 Tax=Nonomuraea fastidiosa TaxID=46173 RepID=UPI00366E1D62
MKRRLARGDERIPRDCAAILALLTDYLDGALAPARRRAVTRHLRACPGCARRLAQLRATIAALGCLRSGSLTPATLAALRACFAHASHRADPARGERPRDFRRTRRPATRNGPGNGPRRRR